MFQIGLTAFKDFVKIRQVGHLHERHVLGANFGRNQDLFSKRINQLLDSLLPRVRVQISGLRRVLIEIVLRRFEWTDSVKFGRFTRKVVEARPLVVPVDLGGQSKDVHWESTLKEKNIWKLEDVFVELYLGLMTTLQLILKLKYCSTQIYDITAIYFM